MKKKFFITFVLLTVFLGFGFRLLPALSGQQTDGIFRANKMLTENFRGQNLFTNYIVSAYFPNDTIGTLSFVNRNYGGQVSLNDNNLTYLDSTIFYIDTTMDLSGAYGFNWKIGGSSWVDSFNYVNKAPMPSFSINPSYPLPIYADTVNDTQIYLSSISFTDSVIISFSRTDSIVPPFIIKHFDASQNTFVIEKELFKQYNYGQTLNMQIEASSYDLQTINGKNYYFINSFDYNKQITVQTNN